MGTELPPRTLRFLAVALLVVAASPAPPPALAAAAKLTWTAPGDDGHAGRASGYEIRLSISPITLANFAGCLLVPGVPLPNLAGVRESLVVADLPDDRTLYFAIRAKDEANNWSGLSNNAVLHAPVLSTPGVPGVLRFGAPAPNPASVDVRFAIELPGEAHVRVALHDAAGRRVRTLVDDRFPAGRRDIVWDLRDQSGAPVRAGVYFLLAVAGDERFVRRVTVRR